MIRPMRKFLCKQPINITQIYTESYFIVRIGVFFNFRCFVQVPVRPYLYYCVWQCQDYVKNMGAGETQINIAKMEDII